MTDFFSNDVLRNPYPLYHRLRSAAAVFRVPPPFDAWMVLDYDGVKRVLGDPTTFSSRVPAPRHWFNFSDPPGHTKLRGLVSRAFTPRTIVNLEPRIRELSRQLLDRAAGRGEMDLAADYSVPLPMMVIAEMIGIPPEDWNRYRAWSGVMMRLSYTRSGGAEAERAVGDFTAATAEMKAALDGMIDQRRAAPRDDLLTRLVEAEVDGQRLTTDEILGFFQLLIVGGQETTSNLINNAVLCLLENPDQHDLLRGRPDLLPSTIEEVLRFRCPVQWLMRTPTRDVELHGQAIPKGRLVLAVIGSANRDPARFAEPGRFDITRDPNPHLAFGHGIHFCLGAALSRMEARIALADLLERLKGLALATDEPWEPRQALHVHGPTRLPIRFQPAPHVAG